ncbi:MAG: DASH family cryptochrome [Cyanobacteriota bacterium]|nr:DASH family cryptochrome [Cyanobacteriota bacterium]
MAILLWFRQDLRLQDHPALNWAIALGKPILPLYCLDPRQFGQTSFGFAKIGPHRAQFLLESLADLRWALRWRGSDLVVRQGHPEQVIPDLVDSLDMGTVVWHSPVTQEELAVDRTLCDRLAPLGVRYHRPWDGTLHHRDQLPFGLADLPELFTPFRQRVEQQSRVASPAPTPDRLPPLEQLGAIDRGEIPGLADLGLALPTPDPRAVMVFRGGERAALERLQHYLWDSDRLKTYKQTRNQMVGADYSSKLSPWLALGCLSPRQVYAEVKAYEAQRGSNESTYWLIFELLWRDYFRFIAAKHGDRLFYPSGLRRLAVPWRLDWAEFDTWRQGLTGFPLVDANLRELAATGFMSNRGRQNVASFLTKNLGLDWRLGAEWFESCLIDYDVCSNYGNWAYTAGVGNDGRGFRYFNILKQAQDYDPQGAYVKLWLPELAALPAAKVHQPWQLLPVEQRRWGIRLGVDYPLPMVDLAESVRQNEARYRSALELPTRADRKPYPR